MDILDINILQFIKQYESDEVSKLSLHCECVVCTLPYPVALRVWVCDYVKIIVLSSTPWYELISL